MFGKSSQLDDEAWDATISSRVRILPGQKPQKDCDRLEPRFMTGLYNHLAVHLFAKSKVHFEMGNMCRQNVSHKRKNLPLPEHNVHDLRETRFSSPGVSLASLLWYSLLNTFYTLWLGSTGRKHLIRNMCFFLAFCRHPRTFPGLRRDFNGCW